MGGIFSVLFLVAVVFWSKFLLPGKVEEFTGKLENPGIGMGNLPNNGYLFFYSLWRSTPTVRMEFRCSSDAHPTASSSANLGG